MPSSDSILGPEGPLAGNLPGFVSRPSQRDMATRIEQAIAEHGIFIAESGTGTGKTFAYLVPALLSGRKVLISTGTKHLQDQIYFRDLPRVRDALAVPVQTALLKGRANYLCQHRLGLIGESSPELEVVRDWSRRTRSGDIGEVTGVPEDSPLWSQLTSTADNCVGAQCGSYEECFVRRARKEALEADVLVVNHHLFFADLALKVEGFGQLLPGVDAVIFDEAHQLADIASVFFGFSVSRGQLDQLVRDTVAEELREHSGVSGLRKAAGDLEKAAADFRLALGKEPRREAWGALSGKRFHDAFAQLLERLSALGELLSLAAGHGEGLASVAARAEELIDRLYLIKDGAPNEYVPWLETRTRGFQIAMTPLDVSRRFSEHLLDGERSWIFTSATLAVNGDFSHFQRQLGLADADTACWQSPFDYARQGLMYLPEGLSDPGTTTYTEQVVEASLPVLEASGGRAFMLFTSYRALHIAARKLAGQLPYPVLIQGDAPRSELLERFRELGNAVLLGTASFWEGVDVRGEALSCVIIDKLPFAAPDDPVLRARARVLEEQGGNPFREMQLPQAVIALKQGVGRLIRDETDTGVLVLCDPRLLSKGYGKIFLASLPPLPRTRELAQVQEFFARSAAGAESGVVADSTG
jgi:ATP-dependent DNA helicase DinG